MLLEITNTLTNNTLVILFRIASNALLAQNINSLMSRDTAPLFLQCLADLF